MVLIADAGHGAPALLALLAILALAPSVPLQATFHADQVQVVPELQDARMTRVKVSR